MSTPSLTDQIQADLARADSAERDRLRTLEAARQDTEEARLARLADELQKRLEALPKVTAQAALNRAIEEQLRPAQARRVEVFNDFRAAVAALQPLLEKMHEADQEVQGIVSDINATIRTFSLDVRQLHAVPHPLPHETYPAFALRTVGAGVAQGMRTTPPLLRAAVAAAARTGYLERQNPSPALLDAWRHHQNQDGKPAAVLVRAAGQVEPANAKPGKPSLQPEPVTRDGMVVGMTFAAVERPSDTVRVYLSRSLTDRQEEALRSVVAAVADRQRKTALAVPFGGTMSVADVSIADKVVMVRNLPASESAAIALALQKVL